MLSEYTNGVDFVFLQMIRHISHRNTELYTVKGLVLEAVNLCEPPDGCSLSDDTEQEAFVLTAVTEPSSCLHFNWQPITLEDIIRNSALIGNWVACLLSDPCLLTFSLLHPPNLNG